MNNNKLLLIACSIVLSLGIFGAGYSMGKFFYLVKKMNRTVTVKGLAERDVKSDLGLWEINYRALGNDLEQINQRLLEDQAKVIAFLKTQGFQEGEINRVQLKIEDRLANVYSPDNQNEKRERYVVTAGVKVRSMKVDLIDKTAQRIDQLLSQGVPLAFDASAMMPNPSYYFTSLDSIRPQMLAEATNSARMVAKQFAQDAGSRLGVIQRASQGVFQIMGKDTSTMSADWNSNQNALGSIDKKIRLVTTIDYGLKS